MHIPDSSLMLPQSPIEEPECDIRQEKMKVKKNDISLGK